MSRSRLHAVTPADIAEVMGTTLDQAWSMARRLEDHFYPIRPSVCGARVRQTRGPKPETRRRLRRLHRYLGQLAPPHPSVHGGARKGERKSCVSGARQHLGRRYVVTRDVHDCYPSISEAMLKTRLKDLGFRSDTATLLSSLLTIEGSVALGSPVSSDALNLFLQPADHRLAERASRNGMPFERTHDDLVISADNLGDARRGGRWLEREIVKAGLRVSDTKKADHGIQPASQRQLVHNIQVNSPHGTRAVKEQVNTALSLGESYVRSAKCVSADSLEPLANKRERLMGWIHHLDQLHFSPVRQLRRLLRHGDGHVQRKLQSFDLKPYKGKWWFRSPNRNEPTRVAQRWKQVIQARKTTDA